MKTKAEFSAFYDAQLKPSIQTLEQKRLSITNRLSFKKYRRWLLILVITTVVVMIATNFIPGLEPPQFFFLIFATIVYAVIAPLYIFVRRNWVFDPVVKEYKQTVIPKLVGFLDRRLTYKPESGIAQATFMRSGLFDEPTAFQTEDLISGQAGQITVQFADINASRKMNKGTGRDMNNAGSTDIINIFYGLFGVMKLNKAASDSVWIKPKYVETGIDLVNSLAKQFMNIQSLPGMGSNEPGHLITTGHANFDENFSVRCSGENAGRIVTPLFINLLMAFKDEAQAPVYIAVAGDELFVGFSGINLFEINAHTSLTERNVTLEYFTRLNLAIGLGEHIDQS